MHAHATCTYAHAHADARYRRLSYPPVVAGVVSGSQFVVGGGGGKAKSGVPNRITMLEAQDGNPDLQVRDPNAPTCALPVAMECAQTVACRPCAPRRTSACVGPVGRARAVPGWREWLS